MYKLIYEIRSNGLFKILNPSFPLREKKKFFFYRSKGKVLEKIFRVKLKNGEGFVYERKLN